MALRSNRDLYLAIHALSKQHKEGGRSLEAFLLAVLNRSASFRDRDSLSTDDFYELIVAGYTHQPAAFDETWRSTYHQLSDEAEGYAGWNATIVRQIVDLREMSECGSLENEYRYFGIQSPRNSQWYNFVPNVYLECGMAGAFGGWEQGDETGRQLLPGPAVEAMLKDPDRVFEIWSLTWEGIAAFFYCGQNYE